MPFQNLNNQEMDSLNETLLKINSKLCDNFKNLKTYHKFSTAENGNSESCENDAIPTNCDYYDPDQFQILIKTLPKNFFSLLHTNIRSLRANHENQISLLTTHGLNFDIISLTETWDANSNSNNFVLNMLEGYQHYNGLSGISKKSGCGFYIKEGINYIDRTDLDIYYSNENHEFGAKWIEIVNKNEKKLLIASIYRHPSKNDSDFLECISKTLDKLKHVNKRILISGDLNLNLLNSGKVEEIDLFLEKMYSNFLQPYIIYPTRIIQNAKPSLIDNIFANCIDKEILSGNLIQNITDHLPNFILLPNYQKSELMMKYNKRDYSKFNEKEYLIDLNNANVSNAILDSNDTSIKYDIFHNHLLQTLDKHAPIVY